MYTLNYITRCVVKLTVLNLVRTVLNLSERTNIDTWTRSLVVTVNRFEPSVRQHRSLGISRIDCRECVGD